MAVSHQNNSTLLQQVAIDTNTLKAIDLANVKPEGFSTALSLTLALSLSILSKVQSLPVSQRGMIEAEVKQVIEAVERTIAKAQSDVAEEEKRSKGGYKLALLEAMPPLFAVLEEEAKTNAALKAALTAAQQFVVYQNVLAIPAIANQRVSPTVMQTVISSVLPPVQTAQVMQNYVSIAAPHNMLTNYVGNETAMNTIAPHGLTKSMLDNFTNVAQNQQKLQQFNDLSAALQEKRQQALASGESTEMIDKVAKEIEGTKEVTVTLIKHSIVTDAVQLIRNRIEERGDEVTPLSVMAEIRAMRAERSLPNLNAVKINIGSDLEKNMEAVSKELQMIARRIEERGENVTKDSLILELNALKKEGNMNINVQDVSLDQPVSPTWTSKVNTDNNPGRSIP